MTGTAAAVDLSISVVIPCYNRVNKLYRALKSVELQTRKPEQIIVVDDGSEKSLQNLLSPEFPKVEWLAQENKGVSSARNAGVEFATGDWIALLDSDDEWVPEKLESQVSFHQKNQDLLASHTDEVWIRNGNQVIPPQYLNKSSEALFTRSLKHCLICPSSAFLHHSLFERIGYFDETLSVCEDYDFWLRLLAEERIECLHEKLTIKHGGHADQLSATTWGMDRFRIKSLEKMLGHGKLSTLQNKAILETLVEKSSILIVGSKKRKKHDQVIKYNRKRTFFLKKLGCIIN